MRELNGAIEIEWESESDLRCCRDGCIRPVKHRIIGYDDVYMCHHCFEGDDWRARFPDGIEFDLTASKCWTAVDVDELPGLWD